MPLMNWRSVAVSALCLAAALVWPASAHSADKGIGSARTAAEASVRVREEAGRTALRQWQEGRKRAAAHARMPDTMYASTPDPAVPDHPFPIRQAVHHATPDVAKSHFAAANDAPAASAKEANVQQVWLFLGASEDCGREGFLRVVNHSANGGEVRIEAVDDAGTAAEPVTLSVDAEQAIHLNSRDLEGGNADKGLPEGIGQGQGDWRLALSSTLDIEALSYVRTADGFVTTMHDTAPTQDDGSHRVAFLNPGSNYRQESHLRLVNPAAEAATVRIAGTDDAGQPGESEVMTEVPAGQSLTFTAEELESGNAPGLSGALGDGAGKWRLRAESERDIVAMSLLATPTGHLANLSAPPPRPDAEGAHVVPLFLSASDPLERQGFLRVVNRSDVAGTVRIEAFDGSDFAYDPVTLSLDPGQARHFNSTDLEVGNADKGLSGSTGAGRGDWRLELVSDLDIEVLAYIRTKDGFVTSMHDLAPAAADGLLHRVAFFNPGSNYRQASHLRLVNRGETDAEATVEGIDDAGQSPGSAVRVRVPAGGAVSLGSKELEDGGDGFEGALGDGKGKWRLWVTSDEPLLVASLLDTPTGHLANLSTAPGRGAARPSGSDAETEAFRALASPIVQSKCVNCHVEGGVSGNTRLVFVTDADPNHLTKNLDAFRSLLAEVEDGADYVLGKIQGVSHGGGVQVAAGTDEFTDMERFLGVLGGSGSGPSGGVTPATLFDGVTMEPARSTLRRAAIVFAGRVPTEEEYASIETGGTASLRTAIRGLMEGPGFHEFLIRASNDRLLTDREEEIVGESHSFVDFTNKRYELATAALASGDDTEYVQWEQAAQYGFRRAPHELIARVVENDLPYSEVLTADYVMANPHAAEAYGASTEFPDPTSVHSFRPSEIVSYYRVGDDFETEFDPTLNLRRVVDPGSLTTNYPHAGILNTKVFLQRYPTTATNRNRARSRWTYYHFLGVDVEKSASRTTDPLALADTNNPTMHNPACTVCHSVLDPVAGAFQNYGDAGLYRDQWEGQDSLDEFHKSDPPGRKDFPVHSRMRRGETVGLGSVKLSSGDNELGLRNLRKFEGDAKLHLGLGYVTVRSPNGEVVQQYDVRDMAEEEACGGPASVGYKLWDCSHELLVLPLSVPADGVYTVEIEAWVFEEGEKPATMMVWMPGPFYRKGDTWYRDMRTPGFAGQTVPDADNSLRWLAHQIVADDRFAEATVKFWWPAIMGAEVAEPPEDQADAGFEGRLLASSAQGAEVARLAQGFRRGFHGGKRYNLKDLLVEIVLSGWFRAARVIDEEPVRTVALADVGARRLLTAEELARKTLALTGFQWGRRRNENWRPVHEQDWSALTDVRWGYGLLYGGIDSDGVTERARDLTSVMAGVAQNHAVVSSCPIVMKEFYLLPDEDRRLFRSVDRTVSPITEFGRTFEVSSNAWETFALEGPLRAGPAVVTLSFLNDYYDEVHGDRNMRLDRLEVRGGTGEIVFAEELERLARVSDCNHPVGDHFALHCMGSLEVPVEVPADGSYEISVMARADQAGDEVPKLALSIGSDAERSAGSHAIRSNLATLYDRLLGLTVSTDSPEVWRTYELFVDVWNRRRGAEGDDHFWAIECRWRDDQYFLEGILEDAWAWRDDWDWGAGYGWDEDRMQEHFDTIDWSDPHGIGHTWVVVLAYLMMDYRYLYL